MQVCSAFEAKRQARAPDQLCHATSGLTTCMLLFMQRGLCRRVYDVTQNNVNMSPKDTDDNNLSCATRTEKPHSRVREQPKNIWRSTCSQWLQ